MEQYQEEKLQENRRQILVRRVKFVQFTKYYHSDHMKVFRSVAHVAHMEAMRNACKILVAIPQTNDCLGDLGVNGRIVLICILKK